MELRYYINETLIQEPIGMETFKETLKRTKYHGVVKSVSIEPLEFYGNAYDIITAAYATDLDSVLRFSVEKKCSDSDVFIEEYAGMIDLSTYYVVTGDYCSVRCNVGDITDEEIKFNNRSETVVNIEQLTDMDGGVLSAYDNLNLDLTIPAKKILFQAKLTTEVNDTNNVTVNLPYGLTTVDIMPKLELDALTELGIITPTTTFVHTYGGPANDQFTNTEDKTGIICYYKFDLTVKNNRTTNLYIQAIKYDGTTYTPLGAANVLLGALTSSFVIQGSTTIDNLLDHRIYVAVYQISDSSFNFDFTSKAGSFVNYNHLEELSSTTAKLSLIHETLSRTAEIISGMSVVSNYYAREDSEVNPLNSGFGDGSLKSLVTGMKLRNGVQTDGTKPVLQSSFKDLFLNLNAIDNIGWGIETELTENSFITDTLVTNYSLTLSEAYDDIFVGDILKEIAGSGDISDLKIRVLELVDTVTIRLSSDISDLFATTESIIFIHPVKSVRIEPFEYFYDPTNVALTVNSSAEITRKIEIADIYTRLTVGYEKYADTEDVNSIDTFHTVRNYTTRLKATDKENKQVSKFVACPYAIEFTRRKALDKTTEDWKYDESTFVLEMSHFDGYGYYVKQGMSDTNGTVISPETMYNVALSPARNALRHIAMMFGFNHSGLNLYITGFTGNSTAEGIRTVSTGDYLADSAGGFSLTENQPLERTFNPLKGERIEFEYPLTPVQWEALKLAPYKIITVDGEDTYIDEVTREVTTGLTKFKLIPKNE